MNRSIWTTKDGKKVPIKDMTDSHLINTIRMLRRVGWYYKEAELASAYAAASTLQGEMATYYAEGDLDIMEQESMDDFLRRTVPQYCGLMEELRLRGLKNEG